MGQHYDLASWLRKECSLDRSISLNILGITALNKDLVDFNVDLKERKETIIDINIIKAAYHKKALLYHPDRNISSEAKRNFISVKHAYEHLILENGDGKQENKRHNIDFMLNNIDNNNLEIDIDINAIDSTLLYFKARFLAVLLEYRHKDGSNKGIPISNLKRKWAEIWPVNLFPNLIEMNKILDEFYLNNGEYNNNPNSNVNIKICSKRRKIKTLEFLKIVANDCFTVVLKGNTISLFPINITSNNDIIKDYV
jgi:hypothetical protein